MTADTNDIDDLDLPDEGDIASTGAAADSAETDEKLKRLPRVLRYAMLAKYGDSYRRERLVAEIAELAPGIAQTVAWAESDDPAIGTALAANFDRLAVMRLVHTPLRAEGYKVGKRMLVLPGADYAKSTSWLSPHNLKRRESIEANEENFEEVPGVTDRLRLRVGLDCMTAPVAASVISGEHLRNSAWEVVPNPTPAGEPEARP